MKYWSLLHHSFLFLVVAGSLLFSPVSPVYGRSMPDIMGTQAMSSPPGMPSSLMFRLPPFPGPPVVVVEARGHGDYREHHHDRRDYRPSRSYGHGHRSYDHRWSYGRVHRSLPVGVFTLNLGGAMFSYHSGTYYRHSPRGYVVVQAPIGARVRALPDTCLPVDFEGRRYYDCNEVYYEGDGEDYVVIQGLPRTYVELIAEAGDEVRVRAESLNVRTGPGTRYQVVSKLYRGDIVEVGGSDQGWYHIILANGSYGWILREHTRFYRTKDEVKG